MLRALYVREYLLRQEVRHRFRFPCHVGGYRSLPLHYRVLDGTVQGFQDTRAALRAAQ